MEKKIYGIIYLLIDGTNDCEYIGQTTQTVEARFSQHKNGNQYVDRMIQDHGDLFLIITLKVCYNKKELDYWERRLIKSRDTKYPNGYNMTNGGEGAVSLKQTDDEKAKRVLALKDISESKSGKNHPCFGKSLPQKTCVKISLARRGNSPFKNLIAEIDARHFSYASLAKIMNALQNTISRKISGKRTFTERDKEKLVEIFDRPIEYLLERSDEVPAKISKAEWYSKISAARREESPYKNLIKEIDSRQLNYASLAKLIGMSPQNLSYKMRGKRKFTDVEKTKLVEIFDLPIEYLLESDAVFSLTTAELKSGVKISLANSDFSPYKNLLKEIDSRQLTYTALGKLMNLSQQSISCKILGKRNFTERDKIKLVEIFGKPIDYLLARDDG